MPRVIIRTITTIALGIGAAVAALSVVTGEAIARDAACEMPLRIGFSDREVMGEWQHRRFIGETAFTAIRKPDGTAAMLAEAHTTASGLFRQVAIDAQATPILSWSWLVEEVQPSADLRDIDREDFGASIALVFGKPSLFNRNVPTITYVWGNEAHGQGTVLPMLRRPEVSKAFILQSGAAEANGWVTETRDIRADYRRAFGEELRDRIGVVAIFTDNDQTAEPVRAAYGPLEFTADCSH